MPHFNYVGDSILGYKAHMGAGAITTNIKLDEKLIIVKNGSKTTETGLPNSNVVYYDLEDSAWCCVRPSGTEPKVKFYMGVKGKSLEDAEEKLEALRKSMMALSEK